MLTTFTPFQSLCGGALIGLSATLLMLLLGRVAGVTGIVAGLLPPVSHDWTWRAAFLAGMIFSPLLYAAAGGGVIAIGISAGPAMLLASGLIVGVGVSYGAGCTSGHGICGLARFSPRSLVATLTFMATAATTVYFVRHVWGT